MCTSDLVKDGRVYGKARFWSSCVHTLNTHFALQDKWRNLLKASFALAPADEGVRIYDANLNLIL